MAARSPPSPHPSPPARQLGPRSPRVGRGAEVHAMRSEASGFAGAAREVVADESDKIWVGEEGSGGRRGPGGAAPAHAPLLSAPMGSRRLEGISVEEAMVTRTQLLEEELRSLKEELALCQVSRTLAAPLSPPQRGRDPWGRRAFLPLPWDLPRPATLPGGCTPCFARGRGLEGRGCARLPKPGPLPLSELRPDRLCLRARVWFWSLGYSQSHPLRFPPKPKFLVVTVADTCRGPRSDMPSTS